MHTNLTVGENVEFYGALRLPRHYTAWDMRLQGVETSLETTHRGDGGNHA